MHAPLKSGTTRGNDEISYSFEVDYPKNYTLKPYVVADGEYFYFEDDDRWVDLGLSVLWAAYNVGATSPEEYAGYFDEDGFFGEGSDGHFWSGTNINSTIAQLVYALHYDNYGGQWCDVARSAGISIRPVKDK